MDEVVSILNRQKKKRGLCDEIQEEEKMRKRGGGRRGERSLNE